MVLALIKHGAAAPQQCQQPHSVRGKALCCPHSKRGPSKGEQARQGTAAHGLLGLHSSTHKLWLLSANQTAWESSPAP